MKHLTLAFALALSVMAVNPALAQAEEIVEKDVVVRIGGDGSTVSSATNNTEDFIEQIRNALGDRVAERIQAEFAELNDEERAKLERELGNELLSGINISAQGMGGAEATIAILAITLSLGMPILIVLLVLYFSYRRRRQRMDLIRSFIDAGKDVPEQLLDEQSTNNPLRSGLSLVAVGLGISLAFAIIGAVEASALGLIPLFIGVASLIYYYTDQKRSA